MGALARILEDRPDLFGTRTMNGDGRAPKGFSAAEIYSWLRYASRNSFFDYFQSPHLDVTLSPMVILTI